MTDNHISIQDKHEAHIHYTVSCIGGFMGIFPILNTARFFGSAQTANLIEFVLNSFEGNGTGVILHAVGLTIYCAAIFLVAFIPKHSRLNIKLMSMIIDAATIFLMWCFPKNLPATVYLYPTFFAMAFQWCSFKGAYGFVSATIFSTNNLRMFISSLTEVFFNNDKTVSLKARFFGTVLLFFHAGVAVGWLCWSRFGNSGFLFGLAPIFLATMMILHKPENSVQKAHSHCAKVK